MAGESRDAVVAVPDVPGFGEGARERLLRMMRDHSGLRPTLLWRPVAAVLGWLHDAQAQSAPVDGKQVAVLSLMGSGVQLAAVQIIRDPDGESLWVPERKRAGMEVGGSFAGRLLAAQAAERAAAELPIGTDAVLAAVNAPWRAAIGEILRTLS